MKIAILGLGGFAKTHHRIVDELEAQGLCRLLACADPRIGDMAEETRARRWPERGVHSFTDYRDLLGAFGPELDIVCVPTPIPLHAEMHRACVDAGVACYLEKPPSLDPEEFDGMMRVEARAKKSTAVGFQFMSDPVRLEWKRRLVAGDFGRLRRMSYVGLAPRGSDYFGRNDWAGNLMRNGRLVLDSCVGNANAHFLHALLHWCDTSRVEGWAEPVDAQAEMTRANPIQGPDTVFARGTCATDVEWRLASSHACLPDAAMDLEILECEKAKIQIRNRKTWRVEWTSGAVEEGNWTLSDMHKLSLSGYLAYCRGERNRPYTTLAETRSFVRLHAMLYLAAGRIAQADSTLAPPTPAGPANALYYPLAGLKDVLDVFSITGQLPSEQGLPWASPGGSAQPSDLPRLREVVETMAAAQTAS